MNIIKQIPLAILIFLCAPAAAQELPDEAMTVFLSPEVVKSNKIKSLVQISEMRMDTTPDASGITMKSRHTVYNKDGLRSVDVNFGELGHGNDIEVHYWEYRNGKPAEYRLLHFQEMQYYLDDEMSMEIWKEEFHDQAGKQTGYALYNTDSFPKKIITEKVDFIFNSNGEVTDWKVYRKPGSNNVQAKYQFDKKGRQVRTEYEYYYRTRTDSVKKISTTKIEYPTDSSQVLSYYLNDTLRGRTYFLYTNADRSGNKLLLEYKRTEGGQVEDHFKCRYDMHGNAIEIRKLAYNGAPVDVLYRVNNYYDKSGKLIKRVIPGEEASMVYMMMYEYYENE
jgi:hypothetical protein